MLAITAAAKRKLVAKRGTYELLGCDIIVSQDLQPYLLEVNTNPAMFTDTSVQKELLPVLSKHTLDIALSLFDTNSTKQTMETLPDSGYSVIYNEEDGLVYGSEGGQEVYGLKTAEKSESAHLQAKTINI